VIVEAAGVVDDGGLVTAAGITSGLDLASHLLAGGGDPAVPGVRHGETVAAMICGRHRPLWLSLS